MLKMAKNIVKLNYDIMDLTKSNSKTLQQDFNYVMATNNIIALLFDKANLYSGNYEETLEESEIEYVGDIFSGNCFSFKEQNKFINNNMISDEDREILINGCMWVSAILSLKYIGNGIDYMDLLNQGYFGIESAINNYKKKNKKAFSTLVRDEIISGLEEYVCSNGKYGLINNKTFKDCKGMQHVNNILFNQYGHEMPFDYVSDYLGLSREKINELYMLSQDSLSVDEIDDDSAIKNLSNYILNPCDIADDKVYYEELLDICDSVLNEKEKYVLFNNLGLNGNKCLSYSKLGDIMGCSGENVRYTLNCSLSKIREEIDKRNFYTYNKRNNLLTIDDIKKSHK